MNNRSAIIRFCASALCVALFLTYSTFKGLSSNENALAISMESPKFLSEILVVDSLDVFTQESKPNNNESVSESQTDNTEFIPVSATGAVKGKVIEKFISPYTANTSYNNVYLKNNTELQIDLKEFVNGKLGFDIEKSDEPQVLILHTHATESYLLHNENYYTENDTSRSTNNEYNMIALGKIVADRLNGAGIKTMKVITARLTPFANIPKNTQVLKL